MEANLLIWLLPSILIHLRITTVQFVGNGPFLAGDIVVLAS